MTFSDFFDNGGTKKRPAVQPASNNEDWRNRNGPGGHPERGEHSSGQLSLKGGRNDKIADLTVGHAFNRNAAVDTPNAYSQRNFEEGYRKSCAFSNAKKGKYLT